MNLSPNNSWSLKICNQDCHVCNGIAKGAEESDRCSFIFIFKVSPLLTPLFLWRVFWIPGTEIQIRLLHLNIYLLSIFFLLFLPYLSLHACLSFSLCLSIYLYWCMHACMYVWMHVCMYEWMDACMYIWMDVCAIIYLSIYYMYVFYQFIDLYLCMHSSIRLCIYRSSYLSMHQTIRLPFQLSVCLLASLCLWKTKFLLI